ncbi:MAG: hypothetical protein AABX60_03215, partial [Nanoarchaeota archaeon]
MARRNQHVDKLLVFLVAFLILTLPVSTSAQLGNTTEAYTPPVSLLPEGQYQGSQLVGVSADDLYVEAFCKLPAKECKNQCWTPCSSGSTWYCGSTGAVCCKNDANFCADKCWSQCSSSSNIWVCTDSGAICEPKSKCTDSKYPYPCGDFCWSCGSYSQFKCVSGKGQCETVTCKDPSYPNQCENSCWTNCEDTIYINYTFACNNGNGTCVFENCLHPDWPNKCGTECWSKCGSGS